MQGSTAGVASIALSNTKSVAAKPSLDVPILYRVQFFLSPIKPYGQSSKAV